MAQMDKRAAEMKAGSSASPAASEAPASPKAAKAPSAARQAAVSDYKAAFGKEPPARMSAKAIKNAIETGRVAAGRQSARREQVAGIFGTQPDQAKANAAAAKARAGFDENVVRARIAQQDAMMDRLLAGEQRNAEIADRRSGRASAANPFTAPDPVKITEARLGTARAQAEIAKATGSPKWQAEGLRHVANANADLARMSAQAQTTVTAVTTRPPAPPSVPLGQRAAQMYAKASPALAAYSAGVQMANAYQRAREDGADVGLAAIEAGKAGVVPAAILAAKPIEHGAGKLAKGAFQIAEIGLEVAGEASIIEPLLGFPSAKNALASGAVGVAAKGVEMAAKAVGRVAMPAMLAYGAYQGAKEDKNTIRGAARGAIRSLDPTSIFMARGLGERAFDAAFGGADPTRSLMDPGARPPFGDVFKQEMDRLGSRWQSGNAIGGPGRLSQAQQQQFAAANERYGSQPKTQPDKKGGGGGGRGFANPNNQKAAQEARGVENITDWARSASGKPGSP